jgi:hypothetical protein
MRISGSGNWRRVSRFARKRGSSGLPIPSRLQADEEDRAEALDIQLGDCCIMHGNTVHRSVVNRGPSPRVAGVLRIANLANQSSYERERFYCSHKP